MAGTSESQLMKHFGSKEGLLEAIFESGWSAMSQSFPQILALPVDCEVTRMPRSAGARMERDPKLKELMLWKGAASAKKGTWSDDLRFMELVKAIDAVLMEMQTAGELRPGVHPQAMRSAMIGMF